jgi:hypothetical protein
MHKVLVAALALVLMVSAWSTARGQVFLDAQKAGLDLAIQGEYAGTLNTSEGEKKFGVQVIALGDDTFRAVGYNGGLPGDGWDGGEREQVEAKLDRNTGLVTFEGKYGTGIIKNAVLIVKNKENVQIGFLERALRESPTLNREPPEGAILLFDGIDDTTWDNWVRAKDGEPVEIGDDELLPAGANTKQQFQSFALHIEFMLPFMPKARGQARGNSGVYMQGRYEVQVLDSFGLEGKDNECGGIYGIKAPDVNMCLPPLMWQTYDIRYLAAKFDATGKKIANARITVLHNGVKIHDNVELPKATTAAPLGEGPEPGLLHLQDHGNPVRYRNIWLKEL